MSAGSPKSSSGGAPAPTSGSAASSTPTPGGVTAPGAEPRRDPIPRPQLSRGAPMERCRAALLRAAARTIEFSFGVCNTVAYPVQRVRPTSLASGPVIFVANHRSMLDTPFIRWSFHREVRRRLVAVGGFDFFEPRGTPLQRVFKALVLRFIVDGYRVWMIDRRVDGMTHIPPLTALLESGWSLLLYPEGRRSRSGALGPMQPGAAILARRVGVPVVPIYIDGTQRILPPGVFWPRSGTLRIRVGAPLKAAPLEHPEAFMRRVRAAIEALRERRA